MTKEEAIKIVRENIHLSYDKGNIFEALKTLVPELAEWSEESEDERIREEMIRYFTEMKKGGSAALPYDDCIAYLERQKGQKPTENSVYPHSLDEAIQLYYSTYGNGKGGFDHISLPKFQDIVEEFVKSYGQKPTGWSEEDEKMMRYVIGSIDSNISDSNFKNIRIWFEFIKDRVQSKPHWKPSEEQLEALKYVTKQWEDGKGVACPSSFKYYEITELYEQLKKLM